jgi:eukaryotic-like serine/threonine-protein kinase
LKSKSRLTAGVLLWAYETGGGISAPAVANGVVYVGGGSAVYATTGAGLWSHRTGDFVYSSPSLANGVVYFGSYDGNVYALSARTGSLLWEYPIGVHVPSSPTVVNGLVFVGSWDGSVHAFSLPRRA